MIQSSRFTSGLVLLFAVQGAPLLRSANSYTVVDIGLPPGAVDVSAEAVNNTGVLIGNSLMPGGISRAFVYQNGAIALLALPPGADRTVVRGINDAGQIVGAATFGTESRGVRWISGTPAVIDGLSEAFGINDNGQIVGVRRDASTSFSRRAYLVSGGTATDLGIPSGPPPGDTGGQSDALAYVINRAGQIAGVSANLSDLRQPEAPWSHANGSMQWIPRPAGYDRGVARGISVGGTIVGYLSALPGPSAGPPSRGFVFSGGQTVVLSPLSGDTESAAYGINSAGDIVGASLGGAAGWQAFINSGGIAYRLASLVTDLEPSGLGTLTLANSINDRGQIAGHARNAAGQTRVFLATPIQKTVAVALTDLVKPFTGFAQGPRATSNPSVTLSVEIEGFSPVIGDVIVGSDRAIYAYRPARLGSYAVRAVPVSANYAGSAAGVFQIVPARITLTLGNLQRSSLTGRVPVTVTASPAEVITFDGSPENSRLVSPTVVVTYNGSTEVPSAPGTYAVAARVTTYGYEGSTTGTLIITPPAASPPPISVPATVTPSPPPTAPPAEVKTTPAVTAPPIPVSQTIAFAGIADRDVGSPSFTISAYSTSGLPVAFTIESGPATVSGDTLTLSGVGRVTVRATQAGSPAFAPASVTQSFEVRAAVVTPGPELAPTGREPVAGTYFATSSRATFGMLVRPDRSAVFVARVEGMAQPLIGRFQVDEAGAFTAPTARMGEIPGNGPVLSGRISNRQVSASLDTLAAEWVASAGPVPAGVRDGFYRAEALGTVHASLYIITGGDGRLLAVMRGEGIVEAALATEQGDRTFSIVLPSGPIAGSLDAATGALTATGTLRGRAVQWRGFADAMSQAPRFANISTRGRAGAGGSALIAGFVVEGATPKQLLVRAVGPSLRQFGVGETVGMPQLSVIQGYRILAENTGWRRAGDPAAIAAAARAAGAFAFEESSADSALLVTLPAGMYTAIVTSGDGQAANALVEVYDVSDNTGRLVNLSTRGLVTNGSPLIAGIVVSGNLPKRMLVRAAGPGLRGFGVDDFLAAPELRIFEGETTVAANAGWGDDPGLARAVAQTGAFAFAAGSADAAIVVTLAPGAYTAVVTGMAGVEGAALVEVYELP